MKKNYFKKIDLLHFNRFVYQETNSRYEYDPTGILPTDEENKNLSQTIDENEETVDNSDTQKQDTKKEIKLKEDEIKRNKIRGETMKLLSNLKNHASYYLTDSYAKKLHIEVFSVLRLSSSLENKHNRTDEDNGALNIKTNQLKEYNDDIKQFFENEKRDLEKETKETIPAIEKDLNVYLNETLTEYFKKPANKVEEQDSEMLNNISSAFNKYMPFKGQHLLNFDNIQFGNYKYQFKMAIRPYKTVDIDVHRSYEKASPQTDDDVVS